MDKRLLWSACPRGPPRLPVESLGSEHSALPARPSRSPDTEEAPQEALLTPTTKCIPATRDGKRHQNLTGTSTALLSPNKELTSAGDVKMLFRTSVLRCLTQRRYCCAREQSDPVFTKQGFSRCTFCFQTLRTTASFPVGAKTLLLEASEEITEIFHGGAESLPRKSTANVGPEGWPVWMVS